MQKTLPIIRSIATATVIAAGAYALSACAQYNTDTAQREKIRLSDTPFKETAQYGEIWQADRTNANAALDYIQRLQKIGSHQKALEIIVQTLTTNPSNKTLITAYIRQLIILEKYNEASLVAQRAIGNKITGWEIYALQGIAYDKIERHQDAIKAYQTALRTAPGKLSVLNNMGMSYILAGDPKNGEKILRTALNKPDGKPNVQAYQNLTLALALQGRYEEAKKIGENVLPPHMVEENIAYVKNIIQQEDTWQKIIEADKKQTIP